MTDGTVREALIPTRNSRGVVEAYLYSNYQIVGRRSDQWVIRGRDVAGFTLEAIIDRLDSGLIPCKEVTRRGA